MKHNLSSCSAGFFIYSKHRLRHGVVMPGMFWRSLIKNQQWNITKELSGLRFFLNFFLFPALCRTPSLRKRPIEPLSNILHFYRSILKAYWFSEMLVNKWNKIFSFFNTELQNRPNKISRTIKTTKVLISTVQSITHYVTHE